MTPKIIDYVDGRIVITPEAFIIKELNDIICKYGDGTPTGGGAEPYITFIYMKTSPFSPYINRPADEIEDDIYFDVTQSVGEFDKDDILMQPAISRLSGLWESKTKRYLDSLGDGLEKVAKHLKDVEVTSGTKDSNLNEINRMIRDAGATIKSYKEVEKTVDDEIKAKMKGKSQLGEY